MGKKPDPAYSRNVVEFVAVANVYCKYVEQAAKLKGEELLKILQRLLPLLYIKASLLPDLEPVFDDSNEKFVSESDWNHINDILTQKFGTANNYLDVVTDKPGESEDFTRSSLAEDMADIYQDIKNFLLLYQTGTNEVMNDALWECRMNFENIWGQKLVNSLRAIHKFIYSGEEISRREDNDEGIDENRDTSGWIISKRQKDFRGE